LTHTLQINQHPGLNPPSFSCQIINNHVIDGNYWVELDKTYYYPNGGGQPSDHGLLISDDLQTRMPILDVRKKRDTILHNIGPLSSPPQDIHYQASIDIERRSILTRMHTAQHLISAVADELYGGSTVGNQINTEKTRIDIGFESREKFSRDELESVVNNYIDSAIPVEMSFQKRSELLSDPLVRVNLELLPKNIDELRVITIVDVDICPCAGTHVGNTSQIGHISISKVKSKGSGKLRVEYSLIE
tara:strand:- start:24 stop:761 length:738 start_codon:yes stop_codon:yes gene_type:complete